MKRNPEAAAVEKVEETRLASLEAENAALKAQLQKAEPASVDSAVKDAQITVLKHQVLSACLK